MSSGPEQDFEVSLSEVTHLVVELVPSETSLVGPGQLAAQLKVADWLLATTRECAISPTGAFETGVPWLDRRDDYELKCGVAEVRYGPPLVIGLEPPEYLLGNLAAVALAIYGIKRIWGVQTEFRNHRAEVQSGLSRAQEMANGIEMEAIPAAETLRSAQEQHRNNSRKGLDPEVISAAQEAKRQLTVIDSRYSWDEETCFSIERRRTRLWRGRSAIWTWD